MSPHSPKHELGTALRTRPMAESRGYPWRFPAGLWFGYKYFIYGKFCRIISQPTATTLQDSPLVRDPSGVKFEPIALSHSQKKNILQQVLYTHYFFYWGTLNFGQHLLDSLGLLNQSLKLQPLLGDELSEGHIWIFRNHVPSKIIHQLSDHKFAQSFCKSSARISLAEIKQLFHRCPFERRPWKQFPRGGNAVSIQTISQRISNLLRQAIASVFL